MAINPGTQATGRGPRLQRHPGLEYTALKMLIEAEKRMRQSGLSLWLAGLNPEPLELIQKSELGKTLGRAGMYFNLEQAVKSFLRQSEDESSGR